jgi:prepilin-type N-terminal cleavage/methylation domain-containing protein
MKKKNKGFTLIEMLVVIAIVAILVAIVIPVVTNSTEKAKAATDAANLRAVYAELNIHVLNGDKTIPEILEAASNPTSKYDPDAVIYAVFDAPGFIQVYYVNGDKYYGFDYFSELGTNGPDSSALETIGTEKPEIPGGTWYTITP